MERHILLVCLADSVKYGGFVTYTVHLARALKQIGMIPHIVRIKDKGRELDYAEGWKSKAITLDYAVNFSKKYPVHICYAYWKQSPEIGSVLLEAGASLTIHDPTEYDDNMFYIIKKCNTSVVVVRKTNDENLSAKGCPSVKFIKHPFTPQNRNVKQERDIHAVSISRIDFDKHTEIIAAANILLRKDKRVQIYGALNRLFDFHKLSHAFPNWKDNYHGIFPRDAGSVYKILNRARYMVDMSVIKQDGGGTQYTFLEAIDAGAALILNKKWTEAGTLFQDGINCFTACDSEELANKLVLRYAEDVTRRESRELIVSNASKILLQHDPKKIASQYEEFLKWK